MKGLGKTMLASAVAVACASPAAAQVGGFVFFGDSLTDAGTFRPVLPAGLGRFTTNPDPVWAELLGARYGQTVTPATQGGIDYAQGGARVAALPGVPPVAPTGAAVPVTQQVAQYIGRGVNPDAMHAVWVGGNDISFQLGLVVGGQISSTQAAANVALAATQAVQAIGALQAAGARNIVVLNLPDVGRTPDGAAGGPAISAQISQISALYNTTLQSGLDVLGGNVIRVDANRLFTEILANPAAFGLANTTGRACGATDAILCGPASLVAPNANRTYLFADGKHPTGAGHEIIAGLVAAYLEGPLTAGTLTEGPLAVEQSTFRTVDARMWSAMDTPYDPKRGSTLWASYDYANPDLDLGGVRGDADLQTLSVGGDLRLSPHVLAGAAANFSKYDASYAGGHHKLDETSATIYAGWGAGPWYAGLSALVGVLDYKDVSRSFDVGALQRGESGDTSGTHWGVRLHGGYWLKAGNLNHGPFAKVVYQRVDVDNFAERSGASTSLRYGEQKRESIVGSLGWQAQGSFGALRPFGRVTWEYEFKDDAREVHAASSTLGGGYSLALPKSDNNWALFHVGAAMDFGSPSASLGAVTGYVMGSATAGKDDGDSFGVTVGVRVPF